MRVVYGYLISTDGFDSADATNQLLDAIRDEEGIPRHEWRSADPDAPLTALGVYVSHVPGDDYDDIETFALSTGPIDVPDGDPELLPAPAVPWLDWAHKTLRLPEDADVDGPRWLDVADELAGAAMPTTVASIAPTARRSFAPASPSVGGPTPGAATGLTQPPGPCRPGAVDGAGGRVAAEAWMSGGR